MATRTRAQSTKPSAAKPSATRLTAAQQKKAQAKAQLEDARRKLANAASEESVAKRATEGKKKGRGNPNWKKGMPSVNPAGRPPGIKNQLTEVKLRLMATTGMTPLEFLTAVYRDQLYDDYDINVLDEKKMLVELLPKRDPDTGELVAKKVPLKIEHRIAAATSAAPYVHRKMPIGIDGGEGKPLAVVTADKLAQMSNEELDQMFTVLDRLGIGATFEGGEQKPYKLG